MKKLSEMTCEELGRYAVDVIIELKRKAYGKGYEKGRLDGRKFAKMEYENKESLGDSPQERRDSIVERAKEYVDKTTKKLTELPFYPEFIVNKDNRSVTVILRGRAAGKVIAKGDAKARPDDCFNVHIGKAIALHKALGSDTPAEYLNAPQPTEARIGDVVKSEWSGRHYKIGVDFTCEEWSRNSHILRIIDDSREGEY